MHPTRVGLLLFAWLALCSAAGFAQTRADTVAPDRLVLPSVWPPEYWGMVGSWRLTLADDSTGGRDSVTIQVAPDSISAIADRLFVDHVCRSCLSASVPSVAWNRLGLEPPTSSFLLLMPAQTGIFHAFLGTGWVGSSPCGLHLEGEHSITHASGAWTQVACHAGEPKRSGQFQLIKLPD